MINLTEDFKKLCEPDEPLLVLDIEDFRLLIKSYVQQVLDLAKTKAEGSVTEGVTTFSVNPESLDKINDLIN